MGTTWTSTERRCPSGGRQRPARPDFKAPCRDSATPGAAATGRQSPRQPGGRSHLQGSQPEALQLAFPSTPVLSSGRSQDERKRRDVTTGDTAVGEWLLGEKGG